MSGRVVPLRGVLVVYMLPSPRLLQPVFDVWYQGRRIGTERVKLLCKYFENKFKQINAKFSKVMKEVGIRTRLGYLVPISQIPRVRSAEWQVRHDYKVFYSEFVTFLKERKLPQHLIKWLRGHRFDVEKYVAELEEHIRVVDEYLRQRGHTWEELISSIKPFDRYVTVTMIPINVAMSELEELLDEETRRYLQDKKRQIEEEFKQQIAKEVRDRLAEVLKLLEEAKERGYLVKYGEVRKLLQEAANKIELVDPDTAQLLREELRKIRSLPDPDKIWTAMTRLEAV